MTEKVNAFITWATSNADIVIPDMDCFKLYQMETGVEDLNDMEKAYLIAYAKVKVKQYAYTKRINPNIAQLILGSEYGITDKIDSNAAVVDEDYVSIILEKPNENID